MAEKGAEIKNIYINTVSSGGRYRGIQRNGDLLLILNRKELKQYSELMDRDGRIPFSENHLATLIHLSSQIKDHETIVYGGDMADLSLNIHCIFLGYDVSGDSMYLSPLFTAFFENPNESYFDRLQSKLSCGLNEYGLFENKENAAEFIELVNAASKENVFENDGQLKPVSVYKV